MFKIILFAFSISTCPQCFATRGGQVAGRLREREGMDGGRRTEDGGNK